MRLFVSALGMAMVGLYALAAAANQDEVKPQLVQQMEACGLDSAIYEILPYLTPVELGGDFDGDGALDLAAPVSRKHDRKRGVALCRAGTLLDVVGMSGRMGKNLGAAYFDSIDWWALHQGAAEQGASEGPPPVLIGDAITIGKFGSSSALIYWTGANYSGYWQGD